MKSSRPDHRRISRNGFELVAANYVGERSKRLLEVSVYDARLVENIDIRAHKQYLIFSAPPLAALAGDPVGKPEREVNRPPLKNIRLDGVKISDMPAQTRTDLDFPKSDA